MKKCLFLCLLAVNVTFGQSNLFRSYTIEDAVLKQVHVHIATHDSSRQKPLLVYLDGSGNYPIFYKRGSGGYSTSVPLNVRDYANDYHIVLISKPDVPFRDSLHTSPSGRQYYPRREKYTELYSLDWRAGAASLAIDLAMEKVQVNRNRVIVMGYSEGAQVAPLVAVMNKQVTHLVSIVGNSLNQFYDFLLEARLDVERGLITPTEGQRIVDSLYQEYEKVYVDPTSTTKQWYGETYKKWSSFTLTSPLENMLKLDIPILYIGGGKDNNQNILNMDYARLEFLRKGKKNLTYKVYPNSDHYFQEKEVKDGKTENKDRIDEVHQFALEWVGRN